MSTSKPKLQASETSIQKKKETVKKVSSVNRIYQGFNLDQAGFGDDSSNCIETCLVLLSYLIVIVTLPLSLFVVFLVSLECSYPCFKLNKCSLIAEATKSTINDVQHDVVVRQFERAVILRNGKLRSTEPYGPGLVQYLPCVDVVKFTDLRIICYSVPPQEALTKDAMSVVVDAVVYYKIYDPIWAVVNISDYKSATQYLAATTLRNALGTKQLSEILSDRPGVGCEVYRNMKYLTVNWGVKIVGFDVKVISLPSQLQRAMATEAESYRLANAQIIVAKAEIEATRNLQKATELLMDNPYCMQLRYLQTLQMIAGDKTHTVVMPFAAESLKKLLK